MKASMDDVMLRFALFLSRSWEVACAAATALEQVDSVEFISDWAQANWELLVETRFRESAGFENAFLEPYGEGADCNGTSSRVWIPDALPTHRIVCRPRNSVRMRDLLTGNFVDVASSPVVFDHFAVRAERGWHEQAPPFDCVLGYHQDKEVLIPVAEVSFAAEKLEEL